MILELTTDTLEVVTSAAADVNSTVCWVDASSTTLAPSGAGTQTPANITTATITNVLSAPGANTRRTVIYAMWRNEHASVATDLEVRYDRNGTKQSQHKVTLQPGEALEFGPDILFFHLKNVTLLNKILRVTADVVNATTSFADVTGLTQAILSGKKYAFEAHLIHQTNATTTGSRFGVNGPASPTLLIVQKISGETPGIAATNIAIGAATAYDTDGAASTTGPGATNTLCILSGLIIPSADGTFAIRFQSEIAVASGLTVKAGSWMSIRETDN